MINIIDNACQAMVHAEAKDRLLTIESFFQDNQLSIRILDTGPGIPGDELEKIFEPLYSAKSFGVGLGLPIVKQIMEQHDGEVKIKSKTGKGACVMLRLPAR